MLSKAGIRRALGQTLQLLTPEAKAAASVAIRGQIKALPSFRAASVIALFYPTSTEPDLRPLLEVPGKTFLFPVCYPDRSLTWHATPPAGPWKTSGFGITEPDPAQHPAVPSENIDLVLVPGLAFTATGHRLGHGAGYYDRFLAGLPDSTATAGVCFETQMLPDLPWESHDVPVQQVIHA